MQGELTVEKLEQMEPGVFAQGEINDSRFDSTPVKWVAVRGNISDWTIYYAPSYHSHEFARSYGKKVFWDELITALVKCDEQALKHYRY